jgi:hypothetical protein
MAGIWDLIMKSLAESHDGSIQMIDTSIVRVHQHGGCAGGGETRLIGRSRGGLTTKIHACVDTNGMPVRLGAEIGQLFFDRWEQNTDARLKTVGKIFRFGESGISWKC